MASVVCFGPNNSYLFKSPTKWSYDNLPPALTALFTQEPRIQDVYEVALGPTNGCYVMIYKDAYGNIMLSYAGLPEDLRKWLIPVPGKGVVRDLATLNVSFSATGAWFAFDKDSSIREALPPAFEAAVQQRMTPQGQWRTDGDYPENVSFGPNSAYCIVTRGGGGSFNLNGHLPDLHNFLSQSNSLKDVYPILSPYHTDVQVTCFGTGHVWAAVPTHCLPQFQIFEADFKAACQSATQAVQYQVAPPYHAPAQYQAQAQYSQPPPVQHVPVQHAPAHQGPVHHAPAQHPQPTPVQHVPAQHVPVHHVPAQHPQPTPVQHAPGHIVPAHSAPAVLQAHTTQARPGAHPVQGAHHANSHHSKTETALGVMKNVNQGLKLVNGIMKIANTGSGGDSGGDSGGFSFFGGDSGGNSGGDSGGN